MPDFNAKMHQNRFRLDLRGLLLRGGEGKGRGAGKGRGKKGREGESRGEVPTSKGGEGRDGEREGRGEGRGGEGRAVPLLETFRRLWSHHITTRQMYNRSHHIITTHRRGYFSCSAEDETSDSARLRQHPCGIPEEPGPQSTHLAVQIFLQNHVYTFHPEDLEKGQGDSR